MAKIGFVTPWFGKNIPGGAEAELRGLLNHLKDFIHAEVLTTCVKEFNSDWNENYYDEGTENIEKILVRRFKVRKRNTEKFDSINYKLMNNIQISNDEEMVYVQEMVNSPELYKYIEQNQNEYSLFVFIPYMFGTTYYGSMIAPEKSVLIPCFHNESYVYMEVFKRAYSKVSGIIYHSKPEYDLVNKVYDFTKVKQSVLGEGIDTEIKFDAIRFREKYELNSPFILYAGRKDVGKNVDTLIKYFNEYKNRNKNDLKLVLLGGGEIYIPESIRNEVYDLGFVSKQDKYDAYNAAELLCQPSRNESFSLVIMESWLCETPVLVHGECEVTKAFVKESGAGLYFENYFEFEASVNYIRKNKVISENMSNYGKKFVKNNFSWEVIVDKYMKFFNNLINT